MLGWDVKGSGQRLWSREVLETVGERQLERMPLDGDNDTYFLCVGTCAPLRLSLGNKFRGVRAQRSLCDYPGGSGSGPRWP